MSYYSVLDLEKEPFSTSPDPNFFYHSQAHYSALQRLEIAIRLRRGLSLIIGDVGTGKTTLSRALLQSFNDDPSYIFHIIFDPAFNSEYQFLVSLGRLFGINPVFRSTLDYKEALERYLFEKGVNENKTIVLLIDEGQKLTLDFLEVLRILLNYETNEYKLLQLIILSQTEILSKVKRVENFVDRISMKYIINPLDEGETREMIRFRLRQAGHNPYQPDLFSEDAVRLIYEHTQGYPRKISMICHNALEALVMCGKSLVDADMMSRVIEEDSRF